MIGGLDGAAATDPARQAQHGEARAQLRRLYDGLDARQRLLWDRRRAGVPLTAVAVELELHYDAARRLWHKVLDVFRTGMARYTSAADVSALWGAFED